MQTHPTYNWVLRKARSLAAAEWSRAVPRGERWDWALAQEGKGWPREWEVPFVVFMALHGLTYDVRTWLRQQKAAPDSWRGCYRWAERIGLPGIMDAPSAPRFGDFLDAFRVVAREGRSPWCFLDRPAVQPWVTAHWIIRIPNADLQGWAIEQYGAEQILGEIDLETIDAGENPQQGVLLAEPRPVWDDVHRVHYLMVTCATGRKFMLTMPTHIKTVHEAQAALVGLSPEEFEWPEVRC